MTTTTILPPAFISLNHLTREEENALPPEPILPPSELTPQLRQQHEGRSDGNEPTTAQALTTAQWLCILGAFAFTIPSFGFMQSVGTIQSYLSTHQLGQNYTTSDVGWITGTYTFLSYFLSLSIGPICDRYQDPVLLAPPGILLVVLSFVLLAECRVYWHFLCCFGVGAAAGGCLIATIAMSSLAKVFSRDMRGRTMGLALVGTGIGSILFPLLLRWALPRFGWRWAMRLTALVCAGVLVPGLMCFVPARNRLFIVATSSPAEGEAVGAEPRERRRLRLFLFLRPRRLLSTVANYLAAFRSLPFTLVTAGSFMLEFAIFGVAGLLPTLATSAGHSPEVGYALLAVSGACGCPGRALPGLMGDRIGHFNSLLIMITITLLFMVTLFVPFVTPSVPLLYAFAAAWGFGSGSFLSVTPVCLGRTCETENYGRFYGAMTFTVSFSVLLSIPLSGMLLEALGSQAFSGLMTGVVFAGGVCYIAARAALVGNVLGFKFKV